MKGDGSMQDLDLLLGKRPKPVKPYTRLRVNEVEPSSLVEQAIHYPSSGGSIYKLDYLENVMDLRMEM